MTFQDLNLIAPISGALKSKGYTTPTPIQQQAIPHALAGKDVFGCAQTGTGKTAAFALPILQLLHNKQRGGIKALILAPTRELAIQINEMFTSYGTALGVRHTVIYGGVSQLRQTEALRKGIDVLIATPGRLMDLMQQGFIKLNTIEFFVLDEVDRMLDMGFINDIKRIITKLPAKKQTLFFSATVPPEIKKLADGLLHNPVMVSVAAISAPAEMVKQSVYYVEKNDKRALLQHLLTEQEIDHALIFTRTKHGADKVVKDLTHSGISARAIHGNKSQNARQDALAGFKNRTIKILVATDIASRGIDVDKLTHVFNYELPEVPETYVHRIGRTGRAGESGTAISFCMNEERPYLNGINKLLKKNIEVVHLHPGSVPNVKPMPQTNAPISNNGSNHSPAKKKSHRGFNNNRRRKVA
ncbi:MAG: DEAD/DEAH box helicase [Bacteroidia bacterium]